MNCMQCNQYLSPDARFCPVCGAPNAFRAPMCDRVRTHLQPLAILWLLYAGVRAMQGVLGITLLHHFFGDHGFGFFPFPMWHFAGVSLAIGVIGALLTGYGLMTRQPWGRVMAMIFGIIALLHPVMGTALGIYTLWVMAPSTSSLSYAQLTRSASMY